MARAGFRRRSDGVYEIQGQARRLARLPLALGTLFAAVAMALAAVSAVAVYLVVGLPFLAAAAVFVALRRARRRAPAGPAPSATVLTLARRGGAVREAARDAGA